MDRHLGLGADLIQYFGQGRLPYFQLQFRTWVPGCLEGHVFMTDSPYPEWKKACNE